MNPPSYPATRSQGPPPSSLGLVDESDHFLLDKPGRLAPKWLEDFLRGKLYDSTNGILDVGCANEQARNALAATVDNSSNMSEPAFFRHELLLNSHQSDQNIGAKRADGKACGEVYSCVCQNCRYHFAFYIDRGDSKDGRCCGLNHDNRQDPYHHLVFVLDETVPSPSINTKYYPFRGIADYFCSAKKCNFKVSIEVSEPRLSQHFLDYLTDSKAMKKRLQKAIDDEPERFADLAGEMPNALGYLRVYLRDVIDRRREASFAAVAAGAGGGDEKDKEKQKQEHPQRDKIDQRNKKFYLQFGTGPDASELFHFLEFEEVGEPDNRSWKLPSPEITRPTQLGSSLAFYQDVKSEVETLVAHRVQTIKPAPAIGFVVAALDMERYPVTRVAFNDYEEVDYDLLGVNPDMDESLFWYAFSCQRQTDPAKEPAFFGALQRLARGRNNEELELRVQSYDSVRMAQQPLGDQAGLSKEDDEIRRATELSLQELEPTGGDAAPGPKVSFGPAGPDDADAAYAYFDLPVGQRSDEQVLSKFETLSSTYPSQVSMYREKLLHIARKTNSKTLLDRAKDSMSLEEALSFLGVQKESATDTIVNIAEFAANSGEKDYILVATALRVIGIARNYDAALLHVSSMITAKRYSSYELTNTTSTTGGGGGPMDLDEPTHAAPANLNLPVGLQNIRNTCYLNSILQYLFTVKPIREIVLDSDKYGLEITEENLRGRRIDPGSTRLEEGEAFAGQQFVRELSQLFTELLNTTDASLKPPQRLALAALKNPNQLETDGAKILAKDKHPVTFDLDGKEGPAPPLPARHAPQPPPPPPSQPLPPPPVPARPVAKVQVSAVSENDNTDSASMRSSQTLVNQTEDGWQTITQADGTIVSAVDESKAAVAGPSSPIATTVTTVTATEEVAGPAGTKEQDPDKPGTIRETGAGEVNIVFDPPPYEAIADDPIMAEPVLAQPPAAEPEVKEPTVEEKISKALNDSSVSGTDQQDVEEVMGNIISHLRAAVQATGEDDETGAQRDPITDTFFWTSVTYNRSNGAREYNRTVSPNRWVTAYPDEGGHVINLLDALDNSFQREFITQDNDAHRYERFTSILRLPPILHVHIQRTTKDGGKNSTAIRIPAVLCLDRFMDSPVGSDLFNRRRRFWNLQERLRSLKGPKGERSEITFDDTALGQATNYTDALVHEYLVKQGLEEAEDDCLPSDSAAAVITATDSDSSALDSSPVTDIDSGISSDLGQFDGSADKEMEEAEPQDVHDVKTDVKDLKDLGKDDLNNDPKDFGSDEGFFIVNPDIKRLMDENGISLDDDDADVVEEIEDVTMLDSGSYDKSIDVASSNDVQQAWRPEAVQVGNFLFSTREKQTAHLQREMDGLFADLDDHQYLLHAVVCHAGQTGKSGHYWVWVYDFDRQLWRNYNDSVVAEEPDVDKVLQHLSTHGEPYYLAYVRKEDVDRMVNIPRRRPAEAEEKAEAEVEAEAKAEAEAEAEAAEAQAAQEAAQTEAVQAQTAVQPQDSIMATMSAAAAEAAAKATAAAESAREANRMAGLTPIVPIPIAPTVMPQEEEQPQQIQESPKVSVTAVEAVQDEAVLEHDKAEAKEVVPTRPKEEAS